MLPSSAANALHAPRFRLSYGRYTASLPFTDSTSKSNIAPAISTFSLTTFRDQ
jgi:hypothetical protein